MITNGDAAVQQRKVERFALDPCFDIIVHGGSLDLAKPDARLYRHALTLLQVAPAEAWMVGDHLEWDVQGAQRVGMLGIWVDAQGQGLPAGSAVRPDRIVRSVCELLACRDRRPVDAHPLQG